MAFFPCVLDRFSDVIVTWPAISRRGRPSTMLRACLPIQDLRQKAAASPERTEIEHPAISRSDLVTVGEKVPEALPDQLADFPHGLHGTFLKVSGNLVERGFRRQGVPVVRPSERAKIAMETESLFITLRERGVEDGEQW